MKKVLMLMMSIIVILSIFGCSSQKVQNNNAEVEAQYYEYAQQCIEEGNVEEAIKALEEGIAATGSEKLQQLLDEINSSEISLAEEDEEALVVKTGGNDKQEMSAEEIADKWCGHWATENTNYKNGGFEMVCDWPVITVNDEYDYDLICFYVYDTQSAPASRIAEIEVEISISDIQSDKILIEYDEDGWGNSGKCLLTHKGDSIICKIYDVVSHTETPEAWALHEGEYRLIDVQYIEGYEQ